MMSTSDFLAYQDLPYAWGKPEQQGVFKQTPQDFLVIEKLGFILDGVGEHLFLFIEKEKLNTMAVVEFLSQRLGVKQRDIGFSGLKDKFAVTRQWFSVRLPDDSIESLQWPDNIRLIEQQRHGKKLRRGVHKCNRFFITLRQLDVSDDQKNALEQRLEHIKLQGVPNYFAEQRFGWNMQNLHKAFKCFIASGPSSAKAPKGMELSAARAYLFNCVLAQRILAGNWQQALPGDCYNLNGTRSFFSPKESELAEIPARLKTFDIHPTGPLWGKGESLVTADTNLIEYELVAANPVLAQGLVNQGLKQERRALRLRPSVMNWQWLDLSTLVLELELAAGCFATAVLRELINYNVDER